MTIINILACLAIFLCVGATLLMVVASIKHRLYRRRISKLLKEWEEEDSKQTEDVKKTVMAAARGTKIGLGPLGSN